jgi:hypothetical protein
VTELGDAALEANFFIDHRLPGQIFRNPSRTFLYFEFARAFDDGAWRLFARVANEFRDSAIVCRAIEPDADDYYRTPFAETAQFSFEASEGPDRYIARMHTWPPQSTPDAIAYNCEVVAWTGTSAQWACWGERASGLCVLQVQPNERLCKELIALSDEYLPVLTLDGALRDITANELQATAFRAFQAGMRKHYVNKAD